MQIRKDLSPTRHTQLLLIVVVIGSATRAVVLVASAFWLQNCISYSKLLKKRFELDYPKRPQLSRDERSCSPSFLFFLFFACRPNSISRLPRSFNVGLSRQGWKNSSIYCPSSVSGPGCCASLTFTRRFFSRAETTGTPHLWAAKLGLRLMHAMRGIGLMFCRYLRAGKLAASSSQQIPNPSQSLHRHRIHIVLVYSVKVSSLTSCFSSLVVPLTPDCWFPPYLTFLCCLWHRCSLFRCELGQLNTGETLAGFVEDSIHTNSQESTVFSRGKCSEKGEFFMQHGWVQKICARFLSYSFVYLF